MLANLQSLFFYLVAITQWTIQVALIYKILPITC